MEVFGISCADNELGAFSSPEKFYWDQVLKPACRSIAFASARLFIAVAPFRAIDLPSKMEHLTNIALHTSLVPRGLCRLSFAPSPFTMRYSSYPHILPQRAIARLIYLQPPVTVTTTVAAQGQFRFGLLGGLLAGRQAGRVGAHNDYTVRLWEAATGAPHGEPLEGYSGSVWARIPNRP